MFITERNNVCMLSYPELGNGMLPVNRQDLVNRVAKQTFLQHKRSRSVMASHDRPASNRLPMLYKSSVEIVQENGNAFEGFLLLTLYFDGELDFRLCHTA